MEFLNNLDFARLVPELLLIIIFISFVLEMMKRFDAKELTRDKLFLDFMKEEREIRQAFMREERESRKEGLGRLADELKQTNVLIAANNAVLVSHDSRMTSASERLLHATDPKRGSR